MSDVEDGFGQQVDWGEVAEPDARGLIFAFLFDRAGGARRVGWDEIDTWTPADGLLWPHFERKLPEVRDWLAGPGGLSRTDASALLQQDTRPRVLSHDDKLLLVLRGVNLTPGSDPEDMVSLRLGGEPDRLISIRLRRHYTMHELRRAYEEGAGPERCGALLAEIVARVVRKMTPIVEQIDGTVDDLEERMIGDLSETVVSDLTSVRQRIVALRRYITPQRAVLQQLHKDAPDWFARQDKARLREIANDMARLSEWLDSERERAALLNDQVSNRMSERVGRNVYVLSVLAGLLLVPTLFAGLLGANVAGIPGQDTSWAFAAVIGVTVAIIGVELWLLRRLKLI